MVEVIAVIVKHNEHIYKIGVDEDDIYREHEDSGSLSIHLHWEKIAFDAIRRLVDLSSTSDDETPPQYNNE